MIVPVAITHRSAWLSCFYLVNLVCMPFLVYMTEVSPLATVHRTDQPPFPLAPTLTHALAQQYVAQFQVLYNATTLPGNVGYFYDSDRVVDVMRTVVSPSDCADPATLLNSILGAAYFTPDANSAVLDCVCGNSSASTVGRAWRLNFIVAPSSINALWVHPGNELNRHMGGASFTVYYLFIPDKLSPWWLAFKFLYRAMLSLTILGLAIQSYYRHVGHLCANLAHFPLQPHQASLGAVTRYEVIVGEPSPLVMSNPYVCLAFVADICATSEYMGQACLRVCQTQSLWYFALAMVYLGRLVWCAYGTLVMHNAVRKRWGWAALTTPVDSTQVAVMVYFVGGFLTYLQGLWPSLINVYTWLFALDSTPASDAPDHRLVSMNIELAILVYLVTVCGTPYVLSAGSYMSRRLFSRCVSFFSCRRIWHSLSQQKVHAVLCPPPLTTPTDTKGYIRQWLCAVKGDVACMGGSMYQVFRWHPSTFQAQATIDQTPTDCFVCGYDVTKTLVEVVCVSLVSQIDLKGYHRGHTTSRANRKQFVAQHALSTAGECTSSKKLAVGRLVANQSHTGSAVVQYAAGAKNSPWIM
ncbi:hypothetical protein, variant [Aphanomyces invadans]|uniref:Uncharacterized protein n=1 Tax=Aphanomyces invadans TaxID=157072 RepID=A0A024TK66_9STRA|nr:hypothetical protein, variant [Aphanomyces invadans]ETV94403.1 hypothetical protein, variant [Aphanomyces invadans]|eukprot:XP_008877164.1 hypothetical protein, variant [Aphanomyces invadans]